MNKPHYHFKGTVDTVKELPTENIKEGDCYYVIYPEEYSHDGASVVFVDGKWVNIKTDYNKDNTYEDSIFDVYDEIYRMSFTSLSKMLDWVHAKYRTQEERDNVKIHCMYGSFIHDFQYGCQIEDVFIQV